MNKPSASQIHSAPSRSQSELSPRQQERGVGGEAWRGESLPLLSTAYLPPVQWFAHFAAAKHVLIEQHEHYLKQTYRNRCVIAGPDGPVDLSIPLEKASSHAEIRDLRISDHGHWRHHHWNAIRSAYGHSPFFEYYADDFAPFYERPAGFLIDFNEALIRLIAQLLDIDTTIQRTPHFILPQTQDKSIAHSPSVKRPFGPSGPSSIVPSPLSIDPRPSSIVPRPLSIVHCPLSIVHCPLSIVHCPLSIVHCPLSDLRSLISPRTSHTSDPAFTPVPYYQVFQQRLGFLPNLSIADLLFNMGPEGLIILQKSYS